MALLTALSFGDAQKLLTAYGLRLVDLKPLEAGSVNSNFFLTASVQETQADQTEPREFFARVYEEQDANGASFEVSLNQALHVAGQRVARPVLTRSGETAVDYRGKPFAVYERLPGTVLCQARVTADVTRRVGAALAGVHRAPLGGLVVPDGRFDFDGIVSRLDRVEASGREDLMPGVRRARALVDRLSQERNTELPQGLIHGDLFRDNVLILDGRVSGLLDFESACRGPYVYDLMVTLLAWCFGDGFDAALVRAMVEGYVAERPLGANEVSAMVSEASVACLRFVATRLTDFSLRVAQGQSPVRDYQRFFLRLEALEAGILHSTLDGLF